MTRYLKFRDTAGRQWQIKKISHEAHRLLLAKRTSGAHIRFEACVIRPVSDTRAQIVSLGSGYVIEEERGDGSIRTTRVPPADEVVGEIEGEVVATLRTLREEMLREPSQ